jgi:hypothetical protein
MAVRHGIGRGEETQCTDSINTPAGAVQTLFGG